MRKTFFVITLFLSLYINAQNGQEPNAIPPAIQWQKCIGGNAEDVICSMLNTPDGGLIFCGTSLSADGDIGGNYGYTDIFVMKTDATGNIQWRKNYGGSLTDFLFNNGASATYANAFTATADGGYIFIATAGSQDGDIIGSGHHGGYDVWVVKIDANGTIQWKRCYGGTGLDFGSSIQQTADGGYILGGETDSNDGDVSGAHGLTDAWVIKIDAAGGIQWQKTFGGSSGDFEAKVIITSDGGCLFAAGTNSNNGDVNTSCLTIAKLWMVKLTSGGTIQWQKCFLPGYLGWVNDLKATTDGGYIIIGTSMLFGGPTYPNSGDMDAFVFKCDATGNEQWHRIIGDTTGMDRTRQIRQTSDGGYIIAGSTNSSGGDICTNYGSLDALIIKLNADGTTDWLKTYGGTMEEEANEVLITADGGYLFAGKTFSNDMDVSGNHSNSADGWLVKLNFPGVPVLPTINIEADHATICPGQPVRFVAQTTLGGSAPQFQWELNGVNIGTNNDTIFINTMQNGDIVHCTITSNSPCVTTRTALSNDITITVDPTLNPRNFLGPDMLICKLSDLELRATGTYQNYLWNTGATTSSISFKQIKQPVKYWLDVVTTTGCTGTDTINVLLKECLSGIYVPTGFTPNSDGKNDRLIPYVAGSIVQYKFTIMNRWGEIVFQTSDLSKGWDGTFKGIPQDGNVFVWTCSYQFAGEELKFTKGTFVMIR